MGYETIEVILQRPTLKHHGVVNPRLDADLLCPDR